MASVFIISREISQIWPHEKLLSIFRAIRCFEKLLDTDSIIIFHDLFALTVLTHKLFWAYETTFWPCNVFIYQFSQLDAIFADKSHGRLQRLKTC